MSERHEPTQRPALPTTPTAMEEVQGDGDAGQNTRSGWLFPSSAPIGPASVTPTASSSPTDPTTAVATTTSPWTDPVTAAMAATPSWTNPGPAVTATSPSRASPMTAVSTATSSRTNLSTVETSTAFPQDNPAKAVSTTNISRTNNLATPATTAESSPADPATSTTTTDSARTDPTTAATISMMVEDDGHHEHGFAGARSDESAFEGAGVDESSKGDSEEGTPSCNASVSTTIATTSSASDGSDDAGPSKPSRPTLSEWLKQGPFVLSMAPGFFGFYAHVGALMALEDEDLLEGVSYATGASAGGLVAGLFAAGVSPGTMGKKVVRFRRSDFWDPVGFGGMLKGKKFEGLVESCLPESVRHFDECPVPMAVSAFDVSRLATRTVTQGDIAPALRATCTFPGLFAPVWHPQGVLVDGGIRDTTGMWCVPSGREDCRRVLNVTFGAKSNRRACVPPSRFPTASNRRPENGMEIVSLALAGLPRPHPFAMERGADAMEAAREQVAAVLQAPLLIGEEDLHWIAPTAAKPRPCADDSRTGKDENVRCCPVDQTQTAGVKRGREDGGSCSGVKASHDITVMAGKTFAAVGSGGGASTDGCDRGVWSGQGVRTGHHQEGSLGIKGLGQRVHGGVQEVTWGAEKSTGGGGGGKRKVFSDAGVEGESAGALDGSRRRSKRVRRPKVPYVGL